jgi:hypothetical protein
VDTGILPAFTEISPYIKIIVNFPERVMQPFPSNKDVAKDVDFFFRPNKVLPFIVPDTQLEVTGSLTLKKNVFVDTDMLNEDPVPNLTGECYARQYGLRKHTYAVALLDAHVHTTHQDAATRGRGWQDIIVCTGSFE